MRQENVAYNVENCKWIPLNGACCVIMTLLAMLAGVDSCGTGACSRCKKGWRLSFNSLDSLAMLNLMMSVTIVFTFSGTGVDGMVTGAAPEGSPCPPSTFDDEVEGCDVIVLTLVDVSFCMVKFIYSITKLDLT